MRFARAKENNGYMCTTGDVGAILVVFDPDLCQDNPFFVEVVIIESLMRNTIGNSYHIYADSFDYFEPSEEELARYRNNLDGMLLPSDVISFVMGYNSRGDIHVAEESQIPLPDADPEEKQRIMDEMISLVDKKRFKTLLSVAGNGEHLEPKYVGDDVADKYLKEWAKNKYRLYLFLGRKMKIEKEIEILKDTDYVIDEIIRTVKSKYDRYLPGIRYIFDYQTREDIFANVFDPYNMPEEFVVDVPSLSGKHKMTTLLHAMFENEQFDADIAKVYCDRNIKKKIAISIDPYDFLTMSETRHGWKSCHNIHMGGYSGGGFSYMDDGSTMIAYMYDGDESYRYELNGFKFKGNSKEWRQCVYVSENTCSAIFSRQYPRYIPEVQEETVNLYESLLPDTEFYSKNLCGERCQIFSYETHSDFPYHDVLAGNYEYRFIRPEKGNLCKPVFKVGGRVFCTECGTEIYSLKKKRVLCSDCYSERYTE